MTAGTGAAKANLYVKKILPLDMVKDCFLDYVVEKAEDVYARMIHDDGSFDVLTPVTPTGLVDGIRIGFAAPFIATDGQGHTIRFGAADPLFTNILFENVAAVVYHVGLRYNMVPALLTEINPRTGQVEYVKLVESVGNVADPNNVTNPVPGQLRMVVDSVTEVGVPHIGRTVRVWLKLPQIDNPTFAFEDCNVQWDGFNNFISTAGLLGQTVGFESLNAADYTVHELGATVQRLASGDLRSVPGVLFLAAVTGSGPGAAVPPGNINTIDQHVIAWTVTGWTEITRVDIHGDTKIRVTADAFDIAEPQIEVWNAASVSTFSVDEAGNVTVDGDINSSGDVNMLLGGVTFASGGRIDDFPGGGMLFSGVNPVADYSAFQPSGGGRHHILLDGRLYFGGVDSVLDSFAFSGTPMSFADIDTGGVSIPFTSGSGFAGSIFYTDASILGGLSEGQALHDSVEAPCVIEGMNVQAWGVFDVMVNSGRIFLYGNSGQPTWKFGKLVTWGGWPVVTCPAASTSYVYFAAGTIVPAVTINAALAFADGNVVLARVITDGVGVTDILDLRFFANQKDKSTIVTVGPQNFGSYHRCHNFRTLAAAVAWANATANIALSTDDYGPIEIRMNGQTIEQQQIIVSCPGLKITSADKTGQLARIIWTTVGTSLFLIGADGVEIDGISFVWGMAGASSGLVSWGALGAPVYGFKFTNNRVQDGFNGLEYVIHWNGGLGNPLYDLLVENNHFQVYGASGAVTDYFIRLTDPVVRGTIRNNEFTSSGIFVRNGVQIEATCSTSLFEVSSNWFSSVWRPLMQLGAAAHILDFNDNICSNCADGAIYISSSSATVRISSNYVYSCGSGATGLASIRVTGNRCEVLDNFVVFCNASLAWDFEFVSSLFATIRGNSSQSGYGGMLLSSCSACIVTGGQITSPTTRVMELLNSTNCNVSGNYLLGGGNMAPSVSSVVWMTGSTYDIIFNDNRVYGVGSASVCVWLDIGTQRITVTGNQFSSLTSDVNYSSVGVWVDSEFTTITGNTFYNIGNGTFGGIGVFLSEAECVVSGNVFMTIYGSAIYQQAGNANFTIDGNVIRNCGLAVVVNPLTGIVLLDSVMVFGSNGTVIGNSIVPVGAGFGVTFAVGSANNVGQCNRVNSASKVQDLAAANFIAAPAFPASNNF